MHKLSLFFIINLLLGSTTALFGVPLSKITVPDNRFRIETVDGKQIWHVDLSDLALDSVSEIDDFITKERKKRNAENLPLALNLSNNNLKDNLPHSIRVIKDLEELNLSGNKLNNAQIDSYSAPIMKSLKRLNISHNQFSGRINSDVTQMSLEELNMSNNSFDYIEISYNSPLRKSLRKLNISHNKFSGSVPSDLRDIDLEELDLSDNGFDKLNFMGYSYTMSPIMKTLKKLNISNNKFYDDTLSQIEDMEKLEELDLSGNNLSKIDKTFNTKRQSIKKLTISKPISNWATRLDNRFKQETIDGQQVLRVNASNLKIQMVDGIIEAIQKYKADNNLGEIAVYLDLSNNNILSLPQGWLTSFKNLVELNLAKNQLKEFVQNSSTLRKLDLSENKFGKFMVDMPILVSLDLSKNVEGIDTTWFGLPSLKKLNLETTVIKGGFADLSNLEALSNLKASAVVLEGFGRRERLGTNVKFPKNLEDLDLSYNQMERLPYLGEVKQLKKLNLKGNKLSGSVPSEIIALPNLEALDISFNQFDKVDKYDMSKFAQIASVQMDDYRFPSNFATELAEAKRKIEEAKRPTPTAPQPVTPIQTTPVVPSVTPVTSLPTKSKQFKLGSINIPFSLISSVDPIKQIWYVDLSSMFRINSMKDISGIADSLNQYRTENNLGDIPLHLDLRSNDIEKLPYGELGKIKRLVSLNLANNKLATWNENISDLEELDLSNNNFASFVSTMPRLKKLKIADSNKKILIGFLGMNSLEEADISYNELDELNLRGAQNSLKKLLMSNMKKLTFNDLTWQGFTELKKLEELDISQDKLGQAPTEYVNFLLNIKKLIAWGNPELERQLMRARTSYPPIPLVTVSADELLAFARNISTLKAIV